MTLCIQCAMEAAIADQPYLGHNESTEEHLRKHHPNPEETHRRRRELEKLLDQKNLYTNLKL